MFTYMIENGDVGGLLVVHEVGKVVMPFQDNGLGSRQVVGHGHGGYGGHCGHGCHGVIRKSFHPCFRHSSPKCLEQLQKKTSYL